LLIKARLLIFCSAAAAMIVTATAATLVHVMTFAATACAVTTPAPAKSLTAPTATGKISTGHTLSTHRRFPCFSVFATALTRLHTLSSLMGILSPFTTTALTFSPTLTS
jgi:hypothetical protein